MASGLRGVPILLNCHAQLKKWIEAEYPYGSGERARFRAKDLEIDAEQAMWAFFEKRRANGRVTSLMLFREFERITGTKWHRWRLRHSVVFRAVQQATTRTVAEMHALLQSFHRHLYEQRALSIQVIWLNFDEIPWSFSGSLVTRGTLAVRGATNVVVAEDPNWDKRCASYIPILAVRLIGNAWGKLPLKAAFLLKRTAKHPLVPQNAGRWLYSESESGVVTTTYVVNLLYPYIVRQLHEHAAGAQVGIVFDSASGHKSEIGMAAAKRLFDVAMIPGGLTSYVQPVDVEYAAAVRQEYRETHYADLPPGKLTGKEQLDKIIGWLQETHKAVIEKLGLVRIFERTGITSHNHISIKGMPTYRFEPPAAPPAPLVAKTPVRQPRIQPTLDAMWSTRKRAREKPSAPAPPAAPPTPVVVDGEHDDDDDPTIDDVTQMC